MLGLPRVELLESTTSTLDVAHRIAARGAPAGTLVIANEQTAGRGRGGESWQASPGDGLLLYPIERPAGTSGPGGFSLRVRASAGPKAQPVSSGALPLQWAHRPLLH